MLAIIKYLQGIKIVDACKQFKTIKGIHDSKARVDTNIKVFVCFERLCFPVAKRGFHVETLRPDADMTTTYDKN